MVIKWPLMAIKWCVCACGPLWLRNGYQIGHYMTLKWLFNGY